MTAEERNETIQATRTRIARMMRGLEDLKKLREKYGRNGAPDFDRVESNQLKSIREAEEELHALEAAR